MSAFNWFNTERQAFNMRTKTLLTASGVVTYTAKTGRVDDNFIIDRGRYFIWFIHIRMKSFVIFKYT